MKDSFKSLAVTAYWSIRRLGGVRPFDRPAASPKSPPTQRPLRFWMLCFAARGLLGSVV